jgi:hypothetical protein
VAQVKALLGGFSTPELRALLVEAHSNVCAEGMACRARAALSVDATDALMACPVPVLYLRANTHIALVTNPQVSW